MRKFRSDRANLSDPRIAYTLLLAISLVCTVMGMFANRAENRLAAWQLDDYRSALCECADALTVWREAEGDMRTAAALRFRNAAAALPTDAPREPLLTLAESMRTGDAPVQTVQTLADTFALLAAFDYPDGETARDMIVGTLMDVTDGLGDVPETDAAEPVSGPDTSWYSRRRAQETVEGLFGSAVACEASADGDAWVAETENLRMRFSAFDGSLESFVYIRLGDAPDVVCNDAELLERASEFAGERLRLGAVTEAALTDSLGGFRAVSLVCRAGEYRAVLDPWGRVWSMAKVKR